jgi:hypothetical protein
MLQALALSFGFVLEALGFFFSILTYEGEVKEERGDERERGEKIE